MTFAHSVRWTLVAAALASVGCLDVVTCAEGCPPGTACSAQGVCQVVRTDGGGSGGEGGSTGGSAGGGTAVGSSGGSGGGSNCGESVTGGANQVPVTFSFSARSQPSGDPDAGVGYYEKDEVVSFEVHAGAAIDWNQVATVPPAVRRDCEPNDAGCQAFALDLASVPFPRLRGPVPISARWLDGGLLSPDACVTITVSRLRWSVSLGLTLDAGERVTAPPALDPVGTLYVPIVGPQGRPSIKAITPDGGGMTSRSTTDPVTTLIVHTPSTYVTRLLTVEQPDGSDGGSLRAYFPNGGLGAGHYQAEVGSRFVGAASFKVGDAGFGVFAVLQHADGGGSLIRYNPTPYSLDVFATVVPSGSPGNVVSDRTSIYVGERDKVSRFLATDSAPMAALEENGGHFSGLCLSGADAGDRDAGQVETNLVATSTTPNRLHDTFGVLGLPDGGVGAPLFGRGSGWLWINGTQSTLSTYTLPLRELRTVFQTSSGVLFQGVPAMGALRDGGSPLVYVAATDGVHVIDAVDGGVWSMPVGPADLPLSLDCARSSDGGGRSDRPGTLYTVSSRGIVTALIVDSQGLDGLAAWPRWQRSAGNTGNTLTELNPGCQ